MNRRNPSRWSPILALLVVACSTSAKSGAHGGSSGNANATGGRPDASVGSGGTAAGGSDGSIASGGVLPTSSTEWTQHGHDAARTDFTAETVAAPWAYRWQWNGSGPDGKKQVGHLSVPKLAQPVTGGGRVYLAADDSVVALRQSDGSVAWSKAGLGTLASSFAYAHDSLYVSSGDGHLYRLDPANGGVKGSFTGDAAFDMAPLSVATSIVVPSRAGTLFSIDALTLAEKWRYTGGSPAATPATYSASRNAVVFGTQDLYVHSVSFDKGTRNWRVKPTSRVYQSGDPNATGAEFEDSWPVVADAHGIVFVRYRLDWDSLWASNPFPANNADIRAFLTNNPTQQALYALNLDTGAVAFVPAVGNGGAGDGGFLPMGPQPVVRTVDGAEVAYILWRNAGTCGGCTTAGDCNGTWCDGREDTTMGEMVLDGTTVSGYAAGDLRFVHFIDVQSDEMMNLTMSGDTVFHSHWLINAAERITDRGSARGATFKDPITTESAPYVIWRQCYCPPSNANCNPIVYPGGTGYTSCPSDCTFDAATHYCASGLFSYGDQRGYPPGFYEYMNDSQAGSTPFTIVSNGLVLIKTADGAIMAFGTGTAPAPSRRASSALPSGPAPSIGSSVEPARVSSDAALAHLHGSIAVEGVIDRAVDHRPKAVYLWLRTSDAVAPLRLRIFSRDLGSIGFDPMSLRGHRVRVTGFVTLYWPESVEPEIVVHRRSQISVLEP